MRDLLLLMRAPLAATAAANGLVAVLLSWPPERAWTGAAWLALALSLVASCCLYWAGMVLNDVFDRERDRELHPERALPSGRVAAGVAARLGAGLLVAGVIALACAGALAPAGAGALAGLGAGLAVAVCILGYDGGLKRLRIVGALAMGACRFSNALAGPLALGLWSPLDGAGDGRAALLYAALLGFYVAGLTVVSTFEDEDTPAPAVVAAYAAAAAPVVAGALLALGPGSPLGLVGWAALLAVIAAGGRRTAREGTRARGDAMTVALLKALWLLDLGAALTWLQPPLLGGALAGLGALFVAGKLAAKRLFGPPKR